MAHIINFFANDPLRIAYVMGGTGGIWFWIQEWRKRIRIKVNLLNSLATQQNGNTTIRVEIVNLGASITSIESIIGLEAIQAISHKRVAYSFSVLDSDRALRKLPRQADTSKLERSACC